MFVVPEVDDDTDVSTPVNTTKPITEAEATKEPLLLPSHSSSASSSEIKSDKKATKMQVPPPPPPPPPSSSATASSSSSSSQPSLIPAATKQHRSRRSLFHRNTIHICDQIGDRITTHQQHHSAPPSQSQQSKTGLQSINENVEFTSNNEQQQQQQNTVNARFPRSSTVPYPAYATLRQSAAPGFPSQFYYTDYPTFIHGTISPAQANLYFNTRQPLTTLNTNFQPISPHHQQYSQRPVDVLKPTFLIVSKEAEQHLSAQLSTSNSPVPPSSTTTTAAKPMSKKSNTKTQEKSTTVTEQSSPISSQNAQNQTNGTATITTTDNLQAQQQQQIGIIAAPNPSPYVHYVNVAYATQSPQFFQEGPPETSIIQDDFINMNDYQQASASIRSMPNIALAQVSPHHLYGSPTLQNYHLSQQIYEEQQQQLQAPLTNTETSGVRSTTAPQMAPTTKTTRNEPGETDESSIASLDFAHADIVDVPGSWRYRSVPINTTGKRYRAPIPQAFLDAHQYASDSEPVVRSSSFRHPQQLQQTLIQSRPFGSIPTINRPFDSIRSQQPIQLGPSIRLNEKDVLKIGSFYQSIGTLVYVARSIATLYSSDFDAMANLRDWKKLYTGVPIWLFNTGMNPKRTRSIRLIISELGSSFTLWDTIVNGASDVRLPKARHITLKSLETGTILALKFDDTSATDEFHQYFVKLSCDPRNADLFDLFNTKRRRPVFILRKRKIKKSAISKPSEFNHINKVEENDKDSLYTYSVLVDDPPVIVS